MELWYPGAAHEPAQVARSGRRRWRSLALLTGLVTLGIGLAACGGGSQKASSGSGCSPSGCSSPAASARVEAMAVKYSVCMRADGVSDFPDPTIGSNGLPSWTLSQLAKAPAFDTAHKACKKDLPNLGAETPAEKATANAAALKYATCMRSNGVPNFPDPNGQGLIQINNATGDLEANSPQFEKAQSACTSLNNGFAEQSGVAVSAGPGSGASGSSETG